MERPEMAKKFFAQAQKMTAGMSLAVVAYGAIAYYLIHIGKTGPAILNAQIYPLAQYGALALSAAGIFAMWRTGLRMPDISRSVNLAAARPVQKIFLRTVILCAAAEVPVILGLLLVFFGKQPYDYIPFAAISLAGFFLAFPKKEQWVAWLGIDF